MTARNAIATTAGLLALVVGIGFVDYETGPELGFSLFYLIPIVLASWGIGRGSGIAVALTAAASWLAADLAWAEADLASISLWNGLTRLVIYTTISLLVWLVREDRDRLDALNRQLNLALGAETRLARTDPLTDLANSRHFFEHLELDLRAARGPRCVAVIDIDNFKHVNDAHGHQAGDELLRRVASDLSEIVRGSDVAARMGGDEFAILLRGVEPEGAATIAARIGERVRAAASDFPDTGIGASIGIAWFSSPPSDADQVLRVADAAMYEAKKAGKGSVRIVYDGTPGATGPGRSPHPDATTEGAAS
jgi:diguanylate cyclase (GGDEF)-like protein